MSCCSGNELQAQVQFFAWDIPVNCHELLGQRNRFFKNFYTKSIKTTPPLRNLFYLHSFINLNPTTLVWLSTRPDEKLDHFSTSEKYFTWSKWSSLLSGIITATQPWWLPIDQALGRVAVWPRLAAPHLNKSRRNSRWSWWRFSLQNDLLLLPACQSARQPARRLIQLSRCCR